MPDYSKTIIYKLCCKNLDVKEIYVGSTCNFTRRKNSHKTDCIFENRKNHNSKVYKFIRENGGFENWNMILIEEYPCENILQKVKRERYWYEELKATLNTNNPCCSKKECDERYYKNNKEKLCEKVKEYYKNNSEKVKEYQKEYRKNNLNKVKTKQKENYEKNKDKRKEYYEANKEKINQRKRENYHAKKKNELLKAKE